MLITDPTEKAEWRKFADRIDAVGPYTLTQTIGRQPGRQHRRRAVRASRSGDAGVVGDADARAAAAVGCGVPVDVPPWWRMKKKNAMFYDGAGRGDHARIMMTASTLCTDTRRRRAGDRRLLRRRARVHRVDSSRRSIRSPIDATLAARGQSRVRVDAAPRATAPTATTATYPNLLVPSSDVGTDPTARARRARSSPIASCSGSTQSFYGRDGAARSAAGLRRAAARRHLGDRAVPAQRLGADAGGAARFVEAPGLLARVASPTSAGHDFDGVELGWQRRHGQAAEPSAAERSAIYDTTQPGYGNGGHTYGDALTADDRARAARVPEDAVNDAAELRIMLRLAGPLILGYAGSQLMSMTDTAMVGRLGASALAGVSVGNGDLLHRVAASGSAASRGMEAPIAQALGAGERLRARRLLWQGVRVALGVSLPLLVIMALSPLVLPWAGLDRATSHEVGAYTWARMLNVIPFLVFNAQRSYLQACGSRGRSSSRRWRGSSPTPPATTSSSTCSASASPARGSRRRSAATAMVLALAARGRRRRHAARSRAAQTRSRAGAHHPAARHSQRRAGRRRGRRLRHRRHARRPHRRGVGGGAPRRHHARQLHLLRHARHRRGDRPCASAVTSAPATPAARATPGSSGSARRARS